MKRRNNVIPAKKFSEDLLPGVSQTSASSFSSVFTRPVGQLSRDFNLWSIE